MVLKENVKKNIIKGNTNLYDKAKMCFQFIIIIIIIAHDYTNIAHIIWRGGCTNLFEEFIYVCTSDI